MLKADAVSSYQSVRQNTHTHTHT